MNRSALAVVLWLGALLPAASAAAQGLIVIDQNVTVDSMVSDRFTWYDASGQPRVAVLAHNTGQTHPSGSRGGELREFRYETPGGTRIVRAPDTYASGFGYAVAHPNGGGMACLGGDSSSLGHFTTGAFTRVFEGRHHAIFRFTQNYPRLCQVGGTPPAAPIGLPVTIEWVVATGRDDPLLALTWDMSGIAVNTLNDDARGPYGELLFDGTPIAGPNSAIAGVGWGDRYKFVSTNNPFTLNSAWTWNTPNTIPYVKLWTTAVDATMGTVQTQPITQQDAGGYWGVNRWNTTSADGSACPTEDGIAHLTPCTFNWPYQSINYSFYNPGFQVDSPTTNTRLAWGTNFGFLGQQQYYVHGSAWYGGPLADATAPGWPRKSYSTFVVLGRHTLDPVGAAVGQIENAQTTTVAATIGSVVTTGPAGANRSDTVTYAPAGWNHVYAAWALQAAGNQIDVNFNVAAGSLANPLVIVSNWSAGLPPVVRLNGATLVQDTDYFPSLRAGAQELWLTLDRTLAGATNRLEISTGGGPLPSISIGDVAVVEGDSGTTDATFTVTLSAPAAGVESAVFITSDATALAGSDYAALAVPVNFSIGQSTLTVTVSVNTDLDIESHELFRATLSDVFGATVAKGEAVAVLLDDDGERRLADYDDDFKSDATVYHQSSGLWFRRLSTGGTSTVGYGGPGYAPVRGDFDGDYKTDIAVFHAASGLWFLRRSSDSGTTTVSYGGPQYLPVPGDYDGDARTDVAVFHPPSGLWFLRSSETGTTTTIGFGGTGYTPLRGDFDGDGRADIALYHPPSGLWFMRASSDGAVSSVGFGGPAYTPVPADYDGDGRTDVAAYHASSGLWFLRSSLTGTVSTLGFGGTDYTPVPGDYDGDGRADVAVYHTPSGLWYIRLSSTGVTDAFAFGGSAYTPVN